VSIVIQEARARYETHFEAAAEIAVRAPGRVNIIGEHTDYNEGFVLPMAIERETVILGRPSPDRVLRCYGANFDRSAEVSLDDLARNPTEPWSDYVAGVACELMKLGKPVRGADLMILGDVPLESGLSSSASVEMAALCAFEALGGFRLEGNEAPRLGRRVENEYLGLRTGIMDQFVIRMAKAGHALFLDCRNLEYELVPVAFPDALFVIGNTRVPRGLAGSKYNERVSECAEAVEALAKATGKSGRFLRDYALEDLEKAQSAMPGVVYRRARHVITEDTRTREACMAMKSGDAGRLGELMNASHDSLRDDYEVSCMELDAMVAIARALDGCLGSRMTGAGFGGCTVSLVERDQVEPFCRDLLIGYRAAVGREGDIVVSVPADGAERIR